MLVSVYAYIQTFHFGRQIQTIPKVKKSYLNLSKVLKKLSQNKTAAGINTKTWLFDVTLNKFCLSLFHLYLLKISDSSQKHSYYSHCKRKQSVTYRIGVCTHTVTACTQLCLSTILLQKNLMAQVCTILDMNIIILGKVRFSSVNTWSCRQYILIKGITLKQNLFYYVCEYTWQISPNYVYARDIKKLEIWINYIIFIYNFIS